MGSQNLGLWGLTFENWISIGNTIMIMIGGGFALYKYWSTKKKEYNERMLKGVYSPLIYFFLRNKAFSAILNNEKITNLIIPYRKEDDKWNVIFKLGVEDILKVKDNLDFNLLPQEMLVLFSLLDIFHDFSEDAKTMEVGSQIKFYPSELAIMNEIYKEAIKGYNKYQIGGFFHKLYLKTRGTKICKIGNTEITYKNLERYCEKNENASR